MPDFAARGFARRSEAASGPSRTMNREGGPPLMHESILQSIGHTPLVKLRKLAAGSPATLAVKVESLTPGGSVKDRVGLAMIAEAEKLGFLKPGGTIIEATAGNTGVGLAMVAAVKGYRCIFVM